MEYSRNSSPSPTNLQLPTLVLLTNLNTHAHATNSLYTEPTMSATDPMNDEKTPRAPDKYGRVGARQTQQQQSINE